MLKKLRVLTLIGALCLSCSAFADNDNKDELKKEIIQLERDTYELIEGWKNYAHFCFAGITKKYSKEEFASFSQEKRFQLLDQCLNDNFDGKTSDWFHTQLFKNTDKYKEKSIEYHGEFMAGLAIDNFMSNVKNKVNKIFHR